MSQNNTPELESQRSCHLWHDQKLKSKKIAATSPGSRTILPSPKSTQANRYFVICLCPTCSECSGVTQKILLGLRHGLEAWSPKCQECWLKINHWKFPLAMESYLTQNRHSTSMAQLPFFQLTLLKIHPSYRASHRISWGLCCYWIFFPLEESGCNYCNKQQSQNDSQEAWLTEDYGDD